MLVENYANKDRIYFTKPRLDLISLMSKNPDQRVLEIGMGGGDTLVKIKQMGLAKEVVGVDLMELENSNQKDPLIDSVHFINLDNDILDVPDNYFDILIAGDVLEHLTDPWGVLSKMSSKVKPGGQILISLPNIREMKAVWSIFFKGRFAYTTEGIFDRTHIRFFCKNDMIQMIQAVPSLKIELVTPINFVISKNSKREIFNRLTFGLFEEFISVQYLFRVVKTTKK